MISFKYRYEEFSRHADVRTGETIVFQVEQWCGEKDLPLIAPWISARGQNWKSDVFKELPAALQLACEIATEWDKDTGKKLLSEVTAVPEAAEHGLIAASAAQHELAKDVEG